MPSGFFTDAVTVSEVNQYLKTLFETNDILNGISIRGEISNFKWHSSGHLYFSLKDDGGILRAVMFRSSAFSLSFKPQDGMKVIASGSVGVYVRDGQYQLYVTSMVPDGVGALWQSFEELKNRLASEGLFDRERKKPIPAFPRKIGIVTSATGAAIRDIHNILSRRYPLAEQYLRPAEVQGAGAPDSLLDAMLFFEESFPVDVIIIGRGGGSMEDLWAFNDENLARFIAACHTPVISAVGHECDFTICDFVADLRAPTPSAAAELAVPDRKDLLLRLDERQKRLREILQTRVTSLRRRFDQCAASSVYRFPERLFRELEMDLSRLTDRLDTSFSEGLKQCAGKADLLEARLHAMNPREVLKRGFCLLTDDSGEVLSPENIRVGDAFTLVGARAAVRAVATESAGFNEGSVHDGK